MIPSIFFISVWLISYGTIGALITLSRCEDSPKDFDEMSDEVSKKYAPELLATSFFVASILTTIIKWQIG